MKKFAFLDEDLDPELLSEKDIEDLQQSVSTLFSGVPDVPDLELSDKEADSLSDMSSGYQCPIKGDWDNLGDFSPGAATDERHQSGHNGIDLAAPMGTPIYPMEAGIVIKVGSGGKSGNSLSIQHANNVKTFYAHCDQVLVKPKQEVDKNTQIATVGMTGNAQGTTPHLHFQVWENETIADPGKFFDVPPYNKEKFSKPKKKAKASYPLQFSDQVKSLYKAASLYNRIIKFLM